VVIELSDAMFARAFLDEAVIVHHQPMIDTAYFLYYENGLPCEVGAIASLEKARDCANVLVSRGKGSIRICSMDETVIETIFTTTMNDALLQKLIQLAKTPTCYESDDQGPWGYCPGDTGNFDEAFSDGADYGGILLAREILDNLGISYK